MRHHPTWAEVKQEFMSTSVPINATCATCRWWRAAEQSEELIGTCRYSPPTASGWPTTNGERDVCASWATDYYREERTGHFLPRCA